ncbi:hypothetical protein KKG46_01735 [Patescibacteria group bacterium]|nr:hypothetical protein [Patescibacteria group bacterium]
MPRLSEFVIAAHETIYSEENIGHISVALRPFVLAQAEAHFNHLGLAEARHSTSNSTNLSGMTTVWFLLNDAEDEQTAELLATVATEMLLSGPDKARIQAYRRIFVNYTAHLLADAWVCAIMDCVDTDNVLKPSMLDEDYLPIDADDLDRYFGAVKKLSSLTSVQIRTIFGAYRHYQDTFIPDQLEIILQNALIQVAA